MDLVLLDSITDVVPSDREKVAVSGSHGGIYAATVASRAGLRAVVLNDAGRGQDDAGVAGLLALETVAMAAVAVSTNSAEIGSARDTLDNGIVSYVNRNAQVLNLQAGLPLATQIEKLSLAAQPDKMLPAVDESRWEEKVGELTVICADSAALIRPEDNGRIIITGSHGGLIGGDPKRACKACAKLVVFNDAGGGKNGIGHTRLPALQMRGIAGLTLDCNSCRIGDAASALATGVVSAVNQNAEKMGFSVGQSLVSGLLQMPVI